MPSGRTPSGSPRLFLGLLLGLVLGLGGAYGAWRLTGGENAAQLAALSQKAARLESDLVEERGRREAAERRGDQAEQRLKAIPPADAPTPGELKALQDKTNGLLIELDVMTDRLATESAARKSAEADALREKQGAASMREARDKLTRDLSAAESQRRDAEQRIVTTGNAGQDNLVRLQHELNALRSDTIPNLNTRLADRDKQNQKLSADLEKSRAEAKSVHESLQKALTEAADLNKGQSETASLRRSLEAAEAEAQGAKDALQAAEARADALARELEVENRKTPAQPPVTVPGGIETPSVTALPSTSQPRAATPRDADDVARVLSSTPGIGTMTASRRDKLRSDLVAGACVSTALGAAFERVPVVTLRNLIRDLKSDC